MEPNQLSTESKKPQQGLPWYLDEKSTAYRVCWWIGLMLILAVAFILVWPMLNTAHE
jgi:hypothetical protein